MAAGEETKGMLSGITCACKQGEQLQLIHGSGVPMSVSNYAPTQTRPGTWSEQRARLQQQVSAPNFSECLRLQELCKQNGFLLFCSTGLFRSTRTNATEIRQTVS